MLSLKLFHPITHSCSRVIPVCSLTECSLLVFSLCYPSHTSYLTEHSYMFLLIHSHKSSLTHVLIECSHTQSDLTLHLCSHSVIPHTQVISLSALTHTLSSSVLTHKFLPITHTECSHTTLHSHSLIECSHTECSHTHVPTHHSHRVFSHYTHSHPLCSHSVIPHTQVISLHSLTSLVLSFSYPSYTSSLTKCSLTTLTSSYPSHHSLITTTLLVTINKILPFCCTHGRSLSIKPIQSRRWDKPQGLAGQSQLIPSQYPLHTKSSTKDCKDNTISFNTIQIVFLYPKRVKYSYVKYIYYPSKTRESSYYFSKDSDLEAFSHNPTDDSFPSLTFQLNGLTNYLNKRFLSY